MYFETCPECYREVHELPCRHCGSPSSRVVFFSYEPAEAIQIQIQHDFLDRRELSCLYLDGRVRSIILDSVRDISWPELKDRLCTELELRPEDLERLVGDRLERFTLSSS